MKFAVGADSYFKSVGFDTTEWRKSNDKKTTMCHLKFAEVLIGDIDKAVEKGNIKIYDIDSEEFHELIEEQFTPSA